MCVSLHAPHTSGNKKYNERRKFNRNRSKFKVQWISACFNVPGNKEKKHNPEVGSKNSVLVITCRL